MLDQLLRGLSFLALAAGSFFVFAMTVGMWRFPDAFTRLHAGTKGLTIGAGLIVLGAALAAPSVLFGLRIAVIFLFLMITNPIATQAIARANYRIDRSRRHLVLDEYQELRDARELSDSPEHCDSPEPHND